MTTRQKLVGEMRTDEASATRNQHSKHLCTSPPRLQLPCQLTFDGHGAHDLARNFESLPRRRARFR
jgi:hypothetical protein